MTGLFISLDDYITDPIEDEYKIKIETSDDEYYYYPSRMNKKHA